MYQEAKAGWSLYVLGQPRLHSENPSLKKKKKTNNKAFYSYVFFVQSVEFHRVFFLQYIMYSDNIHSCPLLWAHLLFPISPSSTYVNVLVCVGGCVLRRGFSNRHTLNILGSTYKRKCDIHLSGIWLILLNMMISTSVNFPAYDMILLCIAE